MRPRPAFRLTAVLLAFGLLATACGLKKDAYNALKQAAQQPGGGGGDTGVIPGTTPGPQANSSGGPVIPGQPGATVPGQPGVTYPPGSSYGPSVGPSGGPTLDPTRKPCDAPSGGNTTGIKSNAIYIGVHAPQTGTGAPLPPSFKDGVQIYWDMKEHYICGRHVVIDFQDDTYKPSGAKAVCGPMSRKDFIVFGAAGTDQIQACATMPDIVDNNVPYLSAGVTSNGLTRLNSYFAMSLTYEQQAALVVRNAQQRGFAKPTTGGGKWAIVTGQSGNFDDATRGAQNALRAAGIPFDTIRVNQTDDDGLQQRAFATGDQLSQGGYGTVYVVTSPGYFIYMTGKANTNPATGFTPTYNPMYTGPGVTMTEVTVAQLACSGAHGNIKANFLAPYPGIDRATPDFIQATGGKYDDIYWALWGSAQLMEQMLNAANRNLTRENFMATLAVSRLNAGVFAPIRFPGPSSPGAHFGGTGAYSQVMNCNKTEPNQNQPGYWDTVGGRIDL